MLSLLACNADACAAASDGSACKSAINSYYY